MLCYFHIKQQSCVEEISMTFFQEMKVSSLIFYPSINLKISRSLCILASSPKYLRQSIGIHINKVMSILYIYGHAENQGFKYITDFQ